MFLLGFIDNARTSETLKIANVGIWVAAPAEAPIPWAGGIVVLHKSQKYDVRINDDGVDYEAFTSFIAGILAALVPYPVSPPDSYRDFYLWAMENALNVRGIVLTSGGAVSDEVVNTAKERLRDAGLDELSQFTCGLDSRQLSAALLSVPQQNRSLQDIISALFPPKWHPPAYKLLLASQCFLWQGLRPLEKSSGAALGDAFEEEVLSKLSSYSDKWACRNEVDLLRERIGAIEFDNRFRALASATREEEFLSLLTDLQSQLFGPPTL